MQEIVLGKVVGSDGESPTATVTKADKTITITMEDKNGQTQATLTDAGELTAADIPATDAQGGESDVQTMLSQSLPASEFTVGAINGTGGVLDPASGGTGVTSLSALFSALGLANLAKCTIYSGQVNVTIPAGNLYASSAVIPFGDTLSSVLGLAPNIVSGNPANKFASLSVTTTGVTVNVGISTTSSSAATLTVRWLVIGQK